MKSLTLLFIVVLVILITEYISKNDVAESGDSVTPCHYIINNSFANNTRQINSTEQNGCQNNTKPGKGSDCRNVMVFWFICTDTFPYGLKN